MAVARTESQNKLFTVVTTATAYADADVMGVPVEITNAVQDPGSTGTLMSLVVLDPGSVKKDFDIYFFSRIPTSMGADDAAFALSDAEAAYLLGVVVVTTEDFKSSSAGSFATFKAIGLGIKAETTPTGIGATARSIWAVCVAREAQTYGASGILIRPHILQD